MPSDFLPSIRKIVAALVFDLWPLKMDLQNSFKENKAFCGTFFNHKMLLLA